MSYGARKAAARQVTRGCCVTCGQEVVSYTWCGDGLVLETSSPRRDACLMCVEMAVCEIRRCEWIEAIDCVPRSDKLGVVMSWSWRRHGARLSNRASSAAVLAGTSYFRLTEWEANGCLSSKCVHRLPESVDAVRHSKLSLTSRCRFAHRLSVINSRTELRDDPIVIVCTPFVLGIAR
jgi:hypothetical protein